MRHVPKSPLVHFCGPSILTFIRLVHLVEKLFGLAFQLWVSMFVRMVEHTQPAV